MIETRRLFVAIAFALAATAGFATGANAVSTDEQGSAGCPTTAPTPNASQPAEGLLAPKGATSVLLCRYHGLNPSTTAHHLERARLLTAANQVAQLTTELDALPRASGVTHCPMDDGSELTAVFAYPRAATATVYVGLTGCRAVSRGRLVRSAAGPAGTRLLARLSALDP
jgi:hypothetical protein